METTERGFGAVVDGSALAALLERSANDKRALLAQGEQRGGESCLHLLGSLVCFGDAEIYCGLRPTTAASGFRRCSSPTMHLDPGPPRRAAVAIAAFAFALGPQCAPALPPPRGLAEKLVPVLESRVLLAELVALALADKQVDWQAVLRVLRRPPFTEVSGAIDAYQRTLAYDRALSADDRKLCFPRDDAACVRALVDADLGFRGLLKNGCMSSLLELEAELQYLSRCQAAGATAGGGPEIKLSDGVRCSPDVLVDVGEVRTLLLRAAASFDSFFDSVPAAELERGMEVVSRRDTRRQIIRVARPSA